MKKLTTIIIVILCFTTALFSQTNPILGDVYISKKLDVVGNVTANALIKQGGNGTNILLDDGTTAKLSGFGDYISFSDLYAQYFTTRVFENNGVYESVDVLFYDLETVQKESIQFTPLGAKADTLYALNIKDPFSNSSDFSYARPLTATRVDVNGLVQTVSADVPRIDYSNSRTGELLLEPSRTNLILRSEEFDNASWLKARSSISANQILAPNATKTADKLIESTDNNNHFLGISGGWNGSTQTFTVYAKYGERNIAIGDGSSVSTGVLFNLQTGTIDHESGLFTGEIKYVGKGFYRCTVKRSSGGVAALGIFPYDSFDTNFNTSIVYLGDGVSGVYIWGAQNETASYETSYIPTTTATVTRNAETVDGAGSTSTINTTAGVLYMEAAALFDDAASERLISVSDGTTANQIIVGYDAFSNRMKASLFNASLEDVKLSYVVTDVTQLQKIAFKWAETDFALWIDGVEVATNTTSSVDAANTYTELQLADGAGANDFVGRIRELKVFPTALTDTELEALTSKEDYTPKHLARTDVDPYFTKDVTVQGNINVEGTITQAPKFTSQGGATDTLSASDHLYTIDYTSGSTKTVTIPTNATVEIPVGTVIYLINTGAGNLTFSTTGITLNDDLTNQTLVQYARRTLTKTATDTWLLSY